MEIIQDVIQRNNPIELMMYMFAIVFTESINLNCFHKLQKSLIDLSVQLLFQNWWESLSHNLLPYPQIIQRGHSRIVNVERRKTIVFFFLSCFDPLDHPKASNEPFFFRSKVSNISKLSTAFPGLNKQFVLRGLTRNDIDNLGQLGILSYFSFINNISLPNGAVSSHISTFSNIDNSEWPLTTFASEGLLEVSVK